MTNDEYIQQYNEYVREMILRHELWLAHIRDLTCCCEGPCIFAEEEDLELGPTEPDGSTIVV